MATKDIGTQIREGIKAGASAEAINALYNQRLGKVQGNTALSQYANDDVMKEAQSYIASAPKTAPAFTDNSQAIMDMYKAKGDAEQASLNAARDQANSDYSAQAEAAPQQFQPLRDQVDVNTIRNIQSQNETAAAKGTTFTGGVQSDQGATMNAGTAQKTALNQQEINFVNTLKKAIADNNKATSYKALEMSAGNTAAQGAALIDEKNRVQSANYQVGRDATQDAYTSANLTGMYNGAPTLAKQQMDTSNNQWQKSFDYNASRDKVGDTQWLASFDYQKGRDSVADGQWLKSFQQSAADSAASRAISWGNLKLNREQFAWSKNPNNPDNVTKLVEGEKPEFKTMFDRAWDMMSEVKKETNANGDIVDVQKYTEDAIAKLIDSSSLSDEDALRLRNMLGIEFDPETGGIMKKVFDLFK